MVICLERSADLHMAQLMLLPLTVSCFSKIQIGFTFLVPAHLGVQSRKKGPWLNGCVCDGVLVCPIHRPVKTRHDETAGFQLQVAREQSLRCSFTGQREPCDAVALARRTLSCTASAPQDRPHADHDDQAPPPAY